MVQPAPQQTIVLSLDDIVTAVEDRRRARRRAALKWILGATIPPLIAGALGVAHYIGPMLMTIETRPYIDRLDSPPSDADRIVIIGTAFGNERGTAELFYKRRITTGVGDAALPSRSVTITLSGDQIGEWSDSRIVIEPTQQQRNGLLASIESTSFENLLPYVRVTTSDGTRRSPPF